MIAVSIQIEGLDAILSDLAAFPSNATASLDRAVQTAADRVAFDTQQMPPVLASSTGYDAKGIPVAPLYGGTMRQNIHSEKLSLLAAGVIAGTDYSGYVHEGTSKMPARPFFQWALEDFGGLQHIEEIMQDTASKLLFV